MLSVNKRPTMVWPATPLRKTCILASSHLGRDSKSRDNQEGECSKECGASKETDFQTLVESSVQGYCWHEEKGRNARAQPR